MSGAEAEIIRAVLVAVFVAIVYDGPLPLGVLAAIILTLSFALREKTS